METATKTSSFEVWRGFVTAVGFYSIKKCWWHLRRYGHGNVALTPHTWLLLEDFLSASVSSFEKWFSTTGEVLVKSNIPFFPLLKSMCRAAPLWQARVPGWDFAHSCKRGCSYGRRVHPAQDPTPRMEMNQCSTCRGSQPPWTMQEGKQDSARDQEREQREGDCNGGDKPKYQPGKNDSFLILKEAASQKCS